VPKQRLRETVDPGQEGKTQVGDRVRFSVDSIFLPTPHEFLLSWPIGPELEGVIVSLSDSGLDERAFAVVDVIQKRTVVVPVQMLSLEPNDGLIGKDLT
jgi:hypothetical protein